jgi:Zn-finger nucleic acid-binding protein
MQCPSCKQDKLKPIKLEPSLAALTCNKCHGVQINLLSYRTWVENNPETISHNATATTISENDISDSKQALLCPKCSKLMTKYTISGRHSNRIDLCSFCDEAWLDQGEWQLLKQLEINNKLTSVFTDPWQKNIRKEKEEKNYEQRMKDKFKDDYTKLVEVKNWIIHHEYSTEIMNFINRK